MREMLAWGIGLATVTDSGKTLDVWYPEPHLGAMPEGGDPDLLAKLAGLETRDEARRVHTSVVRVVSDLRDQPTSTADAYLRLHLLSHRLAEPNTINLDGIRSRLPVVAWTSAGPCAVENFEETRFRLRAHYGHPATLTGVDKFPPMVNYVVPDSHGSFINPKLVPASRLAGASNVLFRRNSLTGSIEALGRGNSTIILSSGEGA